ncbi:hypothetical protein PR048_010468 [Dryococelus australis]|uniref:Uncharacterized protein n=1 Tax=Dryococelus australis TaxID=614101 RepID=A0ABQ9I2T5_9NEOP|nr:hypothetical protein PR048_010468 [Dryococelus australis]
MEQRRKDGAGETGDPRENRPTSAVVRHDSHSRKSGVNGFNPNVTLLIRAERLARSPPTKANRVQSPAGSIDFRKWESCRTMPLVSGFSRGSPVSPAPSFRRRSIYTSITLIGSQDLDVKSIAQITSLTLLIRCLDIELLHLQYIPADLAEMMLLRCSRGVMNSASPYHNRGPLLPPDHQQVSTILMLRFRLQFARLPAPWLRILTSTAVWAHVLMHIAYTWITYMYKTELANYLKNMLHYNIKNTGFIAALPFLFGWLTELGFSILSQWIQRKNYLGLLNIYRIFNAVATIGPAIALIAITQMACDTTAIVVLLVVAKSCSSAFLGGSILNQMDLAINFVGTLSGLAGTFKQIVAVGAPMLTGAIINDQQTLSAWSKVFYASSAISAVPFFIYMVFGSVNEQPWNRPA